MARNDLISRKDVTLHVLSAFSSEAGGGNPAGVVLDADGLDATTMQDLAKTAGYSETAFVSGLGTGGAKLDFFTPNRRINDCGHATVAAFRLLHDTGRIGAGETWKEIVDGRRRIEVAPDGKIFMEQRTPSYLRVEEWPGVTMTDVLDALDLDAGQLDDRVAPMIVDAGGPFVLVAVRDETDLAGIRPDQDAVLRISDKLELTGFYVFVLEPGRGLAATARMFAPRFGIPEESATGMAAGALGAFLHDHAGRPGPRYLIEQGRHMPSPSPSLLDVRVDVRDEKVFAIMTGGEAVLRSARCVVPRPEEDAA